MGFISNLYQKAQEKNILAGILISDLIAIIAYAILFFTSISGIFFVGDFQMVIGVIIGTYFALKYLKKDQTPMKYGMITALGGSFLSAISMYVCDWTIYSIYSIPFPFIMIGFYFFEALIIGLTIGLLEGLYFKSKKPKKTLMKDSLDDTFFESLKTK